MKKKITLLASMVIFIMLLNGCGSSCRTKMSVETTTSTKKSMSYKLFDGEKKYTFKVKKDKPISINVDFTTEEGSIDAYIAKDNKKENAVYSGEDIQTSSFTVEVKDPGTYTIHLDADNHKGSYCFEW